MMSPHNKSKRLGLIYSFAFIMVYSLIASGMPFDRERKVSGKALTPNAPTQVTLNKFVAYIFNDEGDISLEWRSGYEVDNLGYNIYRERDGERRVQLNPSLIAGSALQAGQGVALRAGNSYAWRDKFSIGEQSKQVRYWLESIDLHNQRVLYGPIYARRTSLTTPLPTQSKLLAEYSIAQSNAAQREWPAQSVSLSKQSRDKFNQPVIVSRAQGSPELDKQWELAAQVCVKLSVNATAGSA